MEMKGEFLPVCKVYVFAILMIPAMLALYIRNLWVSKRPVGKEKEKTDTLTDHQLQILSLF
jgi:hypothetical protein